MKRRWAAWLLGLLGVTTSGCESPATSAPTTVEPARENIPEVAASASPTSAATQASDPYAPMRVANMDAIPPPPDLFYNGRRIRASNSGPVNTTREDVAFFIDPQFNKGKNSGRLFYSQFYMENPHDPQVPERRIWFICWSPLNDGERAQRLYNRDGYMIEEVTTDGKRIQVHHTAYVGDRKRVDVYRWKGDAIGKGRFVLEGTPPPNAIPPKPTPFEMERDRGYTLLAERNFAEAIAAFEKALKLKPGDAATHFALGVTYEESGYGRSAEPFTKAIAAYGRAIAADPKRTAAYEHRARLYTFQKKYDQAIDDMTRLMALEPAAMDSYLMRAKAYAGKGDYAKAVADTQKASQIQPREEAPLVAMALYHYRAGKFDAAIASGQKALALDNSETEIRITIACAYARLGKTDKALKVYTDAKDNGVSTTERRFGIRELQRFLKSGSPTPEVRSAVQKLLDQFIGPDQQEPLDEDEEI